MTAIPPVAEPRDVDKDMQNAAKAYDTALRSIRADYPELRDRLFDLDSLVGWYTVTAVEKGRHDAFTQIAEIAGCLSQTDWQPS